MPPTVQFIDAQTCTVRAAFCSRSLCRRTPCELASSRRLDSTQKVQLLQLRLEAEPDSHIAAAARPRAVTAERVAAVRQAGNASRVLGANQMAARCGDLHVHVGAPSGLRGERLLWRLVAPLARLREGLCLDRGSPRRRGVLGVVVPAVHLAKGKASLAAKAAASDARASPAAASLRAAACHVDPIAIIVAQGALLLLVRCLRTGAT